MYCYDGLKEKMTRLGYKKNDLVREIGLSSRTVAKIERGEKLSKSTLNRIALFLHCEPDELYRIVSDNPILQILRDEKNAKISNGLYHELQIRMTYNSNHIEGSRLTEEQTRMIFETNTVAGGDGVLVDDILETIHHFRAIDYVIDIAEEPLSEEHIKKLHYILKHDTRDASLSWFAVGEYKKRPNTVGGRPTTIPLKVAREIDLLLSQYHSIPKKTITDIIAFHYEFERIHPFQDGNGRVGRLIALKECLCNSLIPFIIEDRKKLYYYRGLSEWPRERGYLIDTCLDGQDTFVKLLDLFDIAH